jgi:lipid-binding SYLF domain-containing protein
MKIVSMVVASAMVLASANVWAASGREDSVDRLHAASDVLKSIQEAPDHGIPDSVLNDAKCIIVVPNLVKGGFIFGAKHGRVCFSRRRKLGIANRRRRG